jgi:hypothetical protein
MELRCSKTRGLGLPTDRSHGAGPRAWPRLAAEMLGHTSSKITKESYIQPEEAVDPVTAGILESLALKWPGPVGWRSLLSPPTCAPGLRPWPLTGPPARRWASKWVGSDSCRRRTHHPHRPTKNAEAPQGPALGPVTDNGWAHGHRLRQHRIPTTRTWKNRGQSSAERSCPPGADSPQPRSADHRAVRRNIEASGERSRCVRRRG